MATNDHVVANLTKIVDLGCLANDRVPDATAIDRRAGTDLDIVLDDDAASLRNFLLCRIVDVTKAILPDVAPRMDHHAIADQRMNDRASRADRATAADQHVRPDHGRRGDDAARSDLGPRPDHGSRINRYPALQSCRGMDDGALRDGAGFE